MLLIPIISVFTLKEKNVGLTWSLNKSSLSETEAGSNDFLFILRRLKRILYIPPETTGSNKIGRLPTLSCNHN